MPDAGPAPPSIVGREVALARMATVRTGGCAEWFARAGDEDELRELLAWARAAQAGLSGIEFGVNIPGTVGGAVRMNANAYGGELGRVLEWVEIFTAQGAERRGPDELDFGYRRSNLIPSNWHAEPRRRPGACPSPCYASNLKRRLD